MKSTITFGGALIRVMLVALAVFVPAMALFSGPSPARAMRSLFGTSDSVKRHLPSSTPLI